MAYQVLPPELAALLLKGERDELTSAHDARVHKIKQTPCPRCGSALQPHLHARPFLDTDPLPRYVGRCACGYEVDAQTGVVTQLGSAAKVPETLPLIKRQPQ